jgi:hypothetical protein
VRGWESQRSSAPLYPRGSITGSQGEQDGGRPTEEDFCEAMHIFLAFSRNSESILLMHMACKDDVTSGSSLTRNCISVSLAMVAIAWLERCLEKAKDTAK